MYLMQSIEYCSVILNSNKNMIASGYIKKAPNGNAYCAYEGIPYAQPPIDKLRFEVSICNVFHTYVLQKYFHKFLLAFV